MKSNVKRPGVLLGPRQTTLFSRLIARAIDLLVILAVLLVGKTAWMPLGLVLGLLLCGLQDALGNGQSIGKRIMGLRVIEGRAGQSCSMTRSAIRNLPFILAFLFGFIPVFWILFVGICVPILSLELYLVMNVDVGIRLGDVLADTLVVEYVDESLPHLG